MPWQVPITVDGLEYPVTFNTEGEPSQQDYDDAVQQILSQKAQAAPAPEQETPGYLSQLGSALGLGYRQMKSGVGATFNALTGDMPDVAAEMAEMSKLQREQQALQTPEDVAFMRGLDEAEKSFDKASGPLETIGALAEYPAAVLAQPGAAFKTAVQSAPNALISGATSLAGYGLGGLVGGAAGIETGPGAILTGIAGAMAGGAVSNTLMEAGPAIFDVLNERTQGAASNMTADEISAYLQQNPDIVDEGLKTGAIRGSVIGAVEALGVKGSGRLLTMPERAAARAVQKELVAAGVDVASKEAVDQALLDPALNAATKAAAEAAKSQFSSAGNIARLAGAAAIDTGSAGVGEIAAQAAAGQDISTKEAFMEMLGDAALSLPMSVATKAVEGAQYMLNPSLVTEAGEASAANLAATGNAESAIAQDGFNQVAAKVLSPTEPAVQPVKTAEAVEAPDMSGLSDLGETEGDLVGDFGLELRGIQQEARQPAETLFELPPPQKRNLGQLRDAVIRQMDETQALVEGGDVSSLTPEYDRLLNKYRRLETLLGKIEAKMLPPSLPEPEVTPYEPTTNTRPEILPENLPNLERDPFAEEETFAEKVTPLSEGAERVITPEEESLAAKRRADLLSAAADVAKGKTKAQVSPAVTAMVTPQPVETQEDAASPIQIQESLRQEPENRVKNREAEGAGARDQPLGAAAGEEEVASNLETGAPKLDAKNDYFPQNLASRAWRIAAGMQWDNSIGDWIHPEFQGRPRSIVEAEIAELNPPKKSDVQNIFNTLAQSYGRGDLLEKQPKPKEQAPSFIQVGRFVKVGYRVPVYKNGEVVGGKTNKIVGQITRIMPDGNVEVRLNQGGFKVLPSSEIEDAPTHVGNKPITPPGEPTTATEGMVTPGGVATERDSTKGEQMTPVEVRKRAVFKKDGQWYSGNIDGQSIVGGSENYVNAQGENRQATIGAVRWRSKREALAALEGMHARHVSSQLRKGNPVSSAAVDTYGITLPEGYVKQDDLYIFQPQTKAAETLSTSLQGNLPLEETPEQTSNRIKKQTIRFASGMSAIGDLRKGSYARAGHKNYGIGFDVGLLSKNAIKELADFVINLRTQVFIDSGAFSNFKKGLKVKSGDKQIAPLDFDQILAKYDSIISAIQQANEVEETDYPRPMLVMPDVIGNQAESLSLTERYKNWIAVEAAQNTSIPIIPIPLGELTLSQAYNKILDILNSNNLGIKVDPRKLVVGVPSNAEAISRDDLAQFLSESKPPRIHFLGAAADKNLNPLIEVVSQNSPTTQVTADASKVRSAILNGVSKGKSRGQAIFDALYQEDDPLVVLDAAREESPQTTAAEKQTPAPSRKGAGAAGVTERQPSGGSIPEVAPSETQETQPSTKEIPSIKDQSDLEKATDVNTSIDAGIDSILTEQEKNEAAIELGENSWGDRALDKFKVAYAEWLVTARQFSKKLAILFSKVAKSIRVFVIGSAVAVSSNTGDAAYLGSVPSEAIAELKAFQPALKPISLSAKKPEFPITPAIDIEIPSGFKPITLKVSKSEKAKFGANKAPESVVLTANWIVANKDTGGRPFVVADKKGGMVYVFDGSGLLKLKSPGLFGKNIGDEVGDNRTPSGRFEATIQEAAEGDYEYGKTLDFKELENSILAIHRVYLAVPSEKRLARLGSKSPADNRISHGCVNVSDEAFDDFIEPLFSPNGGVVYILPETRSGKLSLDKSRAFFSKIENNNRLIIDESAALAKEIKKGEEVRRARKSVIDPAKTNIKYGKVTTAIVEAARRQLQNSGEIPNAILTRIYASPEAFLADRSNQRYFPVAYASLMAEPNVEGLYADKTTFVFASNVGVSDLDRGIAEARGISEEQAAARRVIAHENGHRGVDLFEPWELREFRSFVNRTYTTEEIDNLVRLYTEFADWRTNPVSRNEALEEIFQKKFERLVKIPTEGIWDDIVQFLKRVWRRLTGRTDDPTLDNMKDVVRLLRNAMRRTAVPSFTTKDGGEVKLSYAGEKAIENLPEERRQFMRDSLDTAKAMAAAGKSSEEIRAVTGWFPGKYDSKMRWEVPDEGASLRLDEFRQSRTAGNSPEEVTRNFFSEKQARQQDEALASARGMPKEQLLAFSRDFTARKKAENAALYEFFVKGDNKDNGRVPLGFILNHPALFEAYPEIQWVPVSFNASDASEDATEAGSFNPSTGVLFLSPLGFDKKGETLSTALHEIQHWIQGQEGFSKGASPMSFFGADAFYQDWSQIDELHQLAKELGRTIDGALEYYSEIGLERPEQRLVDIAKDYTPERAAELKEYWRKRQSMFSAYENTAGEIEARDVQARKDLTPEQRAATAPYSSENIAPEDAIVMFGGGGAQMSMATPEMDAEYLAAVEAGDMETAQRMVNEAAKAAGYGDERWSHFSKSKNFNEFLMEKAAHIGHHFGSEDQALSVRNREERKGNVGGKMFNVFLSMKRPLRVKDGGSSVTRSTTVSSGGKYFYNAGWGFNVADALRKAGKASLADEVVKITKRNRDNESIEMFADEKATGEIRKLLIDAGYDSLVYENIAEGSGSSLSYRRVPTLEGESTQSLLTGELPEGYELAQDPGGGWNVKGPKGRLFGEQKNRSKESAIRMAEASILEEKGVYSIPSDSVVILNPSQIKSADPVTYDDAGKVIPLSQRFQAASPDIRFSRVEYASDYSAASSAGAQLARDTVYDDRIIEMRDAIRRAYEQSNTEAGVAMPLDELYAKAKEFAPEMTENEFGNILQDLYEDNGAVLQEGESAFDIFTPEGRRAGFAVIMPKRAVASRVETEGEAVKSFQEGIEAIESNMFTAKFGGRKTKGVEPTRQTIKPNFFYKQASIQLVDDLLKDKYSIEDIANSLMSDEFLQDIGIKNNVPAIVSLTAEVKNRLSNEARSEKDLKRKVTLEKLFRKLTGFDEGVGNNAGRGLGIRSYITNDPRYRWMYIYSKAEEQLRKDRELAATRVASDLPQTADNLQKTDAKAGEDAGEQVADDVEQFAESEDDTLLREGETALDSGRRSIWERMKDVLRKLALVARARKGRAANAAKASISKEERDAISQMSDAELAKMESDLLSEFDRLSEAFLKGGTEQQKATRKKMVATAKKRAEQGKSIEAEKESEEDEVSRAERTAQNILKDLSERYADPVIYKDGKKPNINEMRELYKQRVKQGVGPTQMSEEAFVKKAVELGADELTAGILWKAAELEIDAREAMRQDKILQRKAAVGARADAQAHRIIFAKERLKRQSGFSGIESNANKDTIIKAFQEQVKTPVSIEDFIARLRPLNVSETVAKRLFTAAEREKADLEAMKKFQAEKRALEEIEMAEKKASQIIYRFEEQYRQGFKNPPEGMTGQEQRDSIIRAFRDQVKNPTSFEEFAERLAKLKVGEEVAERMFLTASRERADLIRVKDIKIAKRKVEIASKQASRLIYETEKRLRQNSMDLETSKSGDSINKAFRDQISDPVSEKEFKQRLERLNVPSEVAGRLFKTAAREKADLEAMEAFRMLEGPDALKRMLREMNKARPADSVPLERAMPWRKILSSKPKDVAEYRQRIFDAISSEESLADLDDAQKAKLADLFTQAWESKRKAILDRMVDNAINQEEAAGRLTQEGADALRSQRQKLVEDINLGILDEDRLMKHLADKFGIKSEFTEAERANIDRLLDILQDDKLNEVKRNKAAYELLEALSSATKIPIAKLLADYWVSSVLSGVNTAASIAMAVMSGGYELTTGAFRILRAGFTNPKELPAEIAASFKAMAEFLKAFGREGRLAWQYLVTGDRAFLDPSMNTVLNDLNYDSIGKTVSLAEKMAKSDKIMQRVMGIWMRSVSRLLTALDSFNSGVTKAGALPIVFRQLNLDAESLKQATEKYNLQLYRDRVIQRDFNGNKPTTAHDKALVDSYAKAEMMADLQEFGKFSENADFFGQQGAMTLDPTGVGGFIYSSIKSLTGGATNRADKFLAEAEREWKQAEGGNKTAKGLQLAFAYFLQFGAYNSANLAGLRFARFAGNKFNQGLSFIPGIGMFRMYEATVKDSKIEAKDAFTDMILRNQTAGVLFAIIGAMALKAITDEPDDEKRGFFWNGGWANLTPDRKQQKLAAGQKEYTIGIPGGISFNYQNWPISPIMAAIGSLSDLARFSPEQWNEKSVIGRLGSAAASGVFSAGEIPALSGFQTLFGNNLSSKDPNEKRLDRFAKVMAGWGGGFVPRILKDIDFMTDPGLRKYESLWEQTASHIPVYRRYSGEEYYDILGKQIERKVWPGSREFMELETDPEYRTLGKLNSRGIWLTPANAEHRMVGKGRNKRKLTQEEADAYSLETGKGYRQMLLRYGSRLEQMPTERARAFLMDKADEVRDRALKKIVR